MTAPNFEAALDRIKLATGTRTQVELAAMLGIRQSSISDAKRRESIPPEWLLRLLEKLALNPVWVLEGGDIPQFLAPSRDKLTPADYSPPPPPEPDKGAALELFRRLHPEAMIVFPPSDSMGAALWADFLRTFKPKPLAYPDPASNEGA